MLFNSLDFAIFLPIVFVLYWLLNRDLRVQNSFLILTGFVFYGWWDWRFLGLLIFTSGTDYLVAMGMERATSEARRKALLGVSLVANLGLLGYFKYYDFFINSFHEAFTFMGLPFGLRALGLVLPVGISFYTFQSLSYTIDVYRKQLKATSDPITFFAFVSFFPQMLAGPIERARNMIPQFLKPRVFDTAMARDGLRQMLWGLFKKIVVADNCSQIVNMLYADPSAHSGSTMALATVLFAFQIYGDFSGYSDIAIGAARLFGFELMRNFAFPYFSRDIAEFWRRWHISLSTWFRDYLYIPLGGSRGNKAFVVRNTMIIFLVSGFWHGANWTFVAWGAINGLFFLPLVLQDKHRSMLGTVAEGRALPSVRELLMMLITFAMACFAWIFFRAQSMGEAFEVIGQILSRSLFSMPELPMPRTLAYGMLGIAITLVFEWLNRERQYGLQMDGRSVRPVRYALYYGIIAVIILCAPLGGGEFIYFQF
ncbi:MAG: MBOAT family protein [Flavobacteriales bacterium]|nr:MBOAT family protein [Flavobacteriales bacterium]